MSEHFGNFKTGQIWSNVHRSTDGKKTNYGAAVTYNRLDEVLIGIDDKGKIMVCAWFTDVNDGTQVNPEIDAEFFEKYAMLVDVNEK